ISAPAAGEHSLVLAADGKDTGFAARPLHVSHAIYAVVSTDWDDSDNDDAFLANIDMLRMRHPRVVMTQFFGPYVITDPATTQARKDVNLAFVKKERDMFGDEVGVHIHPRCAFVNTTPVTCRSTPSDTMPEDTSGYTVIFSTYTVDEQRQL